MRNLPKNHFRHFLLLFFNQSSGSISSLEAAKKIFSVYGRSAISEKTCKRWLKKFEKHFNLDDHPKSGQKCKISLDFLKEKVEKHPKTTTRKLAEEFKCASKTILTDKKNYGKKEN